MEDDRARKALPLVLVFLFSVGIFSWETAQPLWFVLGSLATITVFLIRRLKGGEE